MGGVPSKSHRDRSRSPESREEYNRLAMLASEHYKDWLCFKGEQWMREDDAANNFRMVEGLDDHVSEIGLKWALDQDYKVEEEVLRKRQRERETKKREMGHLQRTLELGGGGVRSK